MAKLKFFGSARQVSGSCYFLEVPSTGSLLGPEGPSGPRTAGQVKILVDCGMFQGGRFSEEQNYEPFPFNPKDIDFVLVSHAHIDHTGRLPKLFKEGFKGKIFSTAPTKDFAALLLKDSAGLLSKEALIHGFLPLFQENDVDDVLKLWQSIEYDQEIKLTSGIRCIFREAGHILGSAFIEIMFGSSTSKHYKIVFSGDLGNSPAPLLRPLAFVKDADYLVIESTYGDRLHGSLAESRSILEDLIEDTFTKKGVLMVPAFAAERTQELLYDLNELIEHGRVPRAPIFIDSPLAFKLTEVYKKYIRYYNPDTIYLIRKAGDEIFKFPGLKFTQAKEESKQINEIPPPKMIIAGSGMMQGGRILHHLRRYLSDPKSALLIIGYQASNSLGRRILDGAKEVKIFNEIVPVLAKIVQVTGYSAHADQEAILNWIKKTKESLKKVFVVHGDEKSALTLVNKIQDTLGVETVAPLYKEEFDI